MTSQFSGLKIPANFEILKFLFAQVTGHSLDVTLSLNAELQTNLAKWKEILASYLFNGQIAIVMSLLFSSLDAQIIF